MPSLLNCSCFLGAVPRLCSLGEILFLCSANLVLQTCTFQLFQLYNCAAKSTFSVLWQRRRRRGGGAGGTNLLFSRDGKLDICAPVSVFTATAGKYAAHFMDTWRCEIGTGRAQPSTGELLKLVTKKAQIKYGSHAKVGTGLEKCTFELYLNRGLTPIGDNQCR